MKNSYSSPFQAKAKLKKLERNLKNLLIAFFAFDENDDEDMTKKRLLLFEYIL